ncbi:MAG TPA: DinB family protein [Dehalococcoidia bacterium]|nr:DinB family protein [Dehalococcoidia bacterium]
MPLTVNEYFAHFVEQLHEWYTTALTGLTDEQLYFHPDDHSNHIAFQAWHFIRTKDNVINFIMQDRKAPVWLRQNLFEEWDLPKVDQGTGMATSDALSLRLPSVDALIQYANEVHADTMPWVQSVSGDDLQVTRKIMPWGEATAVQLFGQTVVAHGNQHIGQINLLRTMQGLPGEDI